MTLKRFFANLIVCCGAMLSPANATFLSLSVEHLPLVETPNGLCRVVRLYAYFSHPDDAVLSWGGIQGHPAIFETQACDYIIGTPFFNPPQGGNTAPSLATIQKFPFVEWDTFATIGVAIADHGSAPGGGDAVLSILPTFIDGNQITILDGFVGLIPEPPYINQGRAGNDPYNRVLLAQFTMAADNSVYQTRIGFLSFHNGLGGSATIYDIGTDWAIGYGRCCLPAGGCTMVTIQTCFMVGGTYLGCEPCTGCTDCFGDVAPYGGDGHVNVQDLLMVLEHWGACASCSPDVEFDGGDGIVNVADLLAVISAWGPCE